MAKTKKAPVATAADPFFDAEGHPLAVNDVVLVSQEGASIYNGHSGTINGLHREGANAVATVAFKGDSTVPAGSQAFFLKWLTYVASHPAIQDEPDLPWLDCDGNVLHEGDKATVLPDVSARLSGKLVKVLGEYDPQKKSVQVEPVGWEGADFGILLCFLKRLPVLGENLETPFDYSTLPHKEEVRAEQDRQAASRKQEPVAPFALAGQAAFEKAQAPAPAAAPVYTPTKMKQVALADIIVTSNTRKVFDETALGELAESIKAQGVIAPITVRPHATEAGKFELVAGERRYRASKLAGQQTIPAVIRTLTDREFLVVQLLENLQRVDVRPADEAEAFAKLLKNGYSAEEIGQKVGKPVKFVHQRAKLVALVPFWMEALQQERLPLVSAHELARLPAHSQEAVKKAVANYYNSASPVYESIRIKSAISNSVLRELSSAPWPKADASLYPSAGACLNCPKRSSANQQLFDDAGGDRCLDASCFGKKLELFIERRREELTAQDGKPPLLVATDYTLRGKTPGAIAPYDFEKCKPAATNAVRILCIDGPEAGHDKWGKLEKHARPKQASAEEVAKQKEADALRIRGDREKKTHRLLIAGQLDDDIGENPTGREAQAALTYLLMEKLGSMAKANMAFVRDAYKWPEPTEAERETGWDKRDADGLRPYDHWLRARLAPLHFDERLALLLRLEARHKMDYEYEDRQFKIARLIGEDYDFLKQEAVQAVEARYYSKKGKKQEVAA